MREREVELNIKHIIVLILFLLIFILSMFFKREIDLTMWEGLTFKQARVYVKEKDDLRKEIMELERENDLLELRQELEKLKK